MSIKIALAGNPNSGKTTLFNALTGSNQYVGNWPGVTVEKKEGKLKGNKDVIIMDLPGIYSLSPYTLEEVVSRNYLIEDRPDGILNIIDGTNLERNLYLTTQLAELGIPMIIAINMIDVVEKNGDIINIKKLSEDLGCKVIEISALKGINLQEITNEIIKLSSIDRHIAKHKFNNSLESALDLIENKLSNIPTALRRFYAVKLFERDSKILEKLDNKFDIEDIIQKVEKEMDDDSESIIINERYAYISTLINDCYTRKNQNTLTLSDKIDQIVTNRWLAMPIFAVIIYFVYYMSITVIGDFVTGIAGDILFGDGFYFIPGLPVITENVLDALAVDGWLKSLIINGIMSGVGAVLIFVPQMLVLFIFLAFLEGCGYMARVAFIMDRLFRRFGLSGKSFIPMLVGLGCGVPAVMASRTIESDHDRRMTVMTTTFIPCGAKLPIIALIAGALFNGASWVAPSAYFVGIAAIVISGIILKKTKMFAGDPTPFVMELPAYHMPTLGSILRSMWERGSSFIKKAGTVILISEIVLWFLRSIGTTATGFGMVDNLNDSVLAHLGSTIAWIFSPLGFGQWESVVAAITGLIAKENVVATFGVLFGFAEVAEDGGEYWSTLSTFFTPAAAYSFLVFNLLCAPCFAAIGAIKREMDNTKWTWFAIGYQTSFAYSVSLCVYQIGSLITGDQSFGIGSIVAILILITFAYLLLKPQKAQKNILTNVA